MDPVTVSNIDQKANVSANSAPSVKAPTPQPDAKSVSSQDILSRVSASQVDQVQTEKTEPSTQAFSLDEIKDPVARSVAEKKLKDLETGYNKKYMDLAEKRKELDKKLEALNKPKTWTADEVVRLTQDQSFVQAAQIAAQTQAPSNFGGTQAEWSALNDNERMRFARMEQELNNLRANSNQMRLSQIDQALKLKYNDYDPNQIESFQKDIVEGKVSDDQIRELIHLALNAPKYVDRSYKYGLEDRKGNIQEKFNSSSQAGVNVSTQEPIMKRNEGESGRNFFARIAKEKLSQMRGQK